MRILIRPAVAARPASASPTIGCPAGRPFRIGAASLEVGEEEDASELRGLALLSGEQGCGTACNLSGCSGTPFAGEAVFVARHIPSTILRPA